MEAGIADEALGEDREDEDEDEEEVVAEDIEEVERHEEGVG